MSRSFSPVVAIALGLVIATALVACAQRSRYADESAARGDIAQEPAPSRQGPEEAVLESITVTGSRVKERGASRDREADDKEPSSGKPDRFAERVDRDFVDTATAPLLTFSIDVDTGSYSYARRMLRQGQLPAPLAVRTEEFLNYFDHEYPRPAHREPPFALHQELGAAPWNPRNHLLLLGLSGYQLPPEAIPASHLVFLIDVSGSMQVPDRLPLAKAALKLLTRQLRPVDHVSMVVYAGAAGMVLPPTSGRDQERILAAIDSLEAGGSTNGGDGIYLAYRLAERFHADAPVRRILLLTDGDFNVGVSGVDELKRLVEVKRQSGIALSTFGFGQGGYHDAMAEQLADIGNGSHAYIDTLAEAERVFVRERSATLMTIAADVKLQLDLDPRLVARHRVLGYENRALENRDFTNDRVDAGEVGAGHTVTALVELELTAAGRAAVTRAQGDLGVLRLRYKRPGEEQSQPLAWPIAARPARDDRRLRFAAAVAAFAEQLRGSPHVAGYGLAEAASLARGASSGDAYGFQRELVELIGLAESLRPAIAR